MKIKSLIKCWTPSPEMSWKKGEEVDVSDELGEKLLKNNNFVKVSETKSEPSEEKENVKYRKKRGIGDRD